MGFLEDGRALSWTQLSTLSRRLFVVFGSQKQELLPFTDLIPSATLGWLRPHVVWLVIVTGRSDLHI